MTLTIICILAGLFPCIFTCLFMNADLSEMKKEYTKLENEWLTSELEKTMLKHENKQLKKQLEKLRDNQKKEQAE